MNGTPASLLDLADRLLWAVTAAHDGHENAQIATWIMPGTLSPELPRVVIAVAVHNYTFELIRDSRRFVLNLLSVGQHDWLPRFGLYSGRELDKLQGIALERTATGLPALPDTCGWAACHIVSEIDAGDRLIYLADVLEQHVRAEHHPLTTSAALAQLPADLVRALAEKQRLDGERDTRLVRRFA